MSGNSIVRRSRLDAGHSGAVVNPLHPSVVYEFEDTAHVDAAYDGSRNRVGYTYAREGHPNARVVADKIDALEGATGGVITSSGMAAISVALFGCLTAGDHIIGGNQLYGRSLRILAQDLPALGFETSLVDCGDAQAVRAAIRPNTKMILIELVSNPTLRLADITAIARLAREAGVLLAVDNTFTTPRGFRPFEHGSDQGADIIIHSITKLLAGHSDVTLGYTVARDPALNEAIADAAKTWGFTPSPFDCWLAERGLHSFELRYDRGEATAQALAQMLDDHPKVARCLYPALGSHPDRALAAALIPERPGTMLSFDLGDDRGAADRFITALENVPFAPSLGDVATLISHPPTSSHRGLSRVDRLALGITEGFIRVSVGIEETALILREFGDALDAV